MILSKDECARLGAIYRQRYDSTNQLSTKKLFNRPARKHAALVPSHAEISAALEPQALPPSQLGRSHRLMAAVGGTVCCPALRGKTVPVAVDVTRVHQC